jgi:hypothetical protein
MWIWSVSLDWCYFNKIFIFSKGDIVQRFGLETKTILVSLIEVKLDLMFFNFLEFIY